MVASFLTGTDVVCSEIAVVERDFSIGGASKSDSDVSATTDDDDDDDVREPAVVVVVDGIDEVSAPKMSKSSV
jgi:hypothetical protein